MPLRRVLALTFLVACGLPLLVFWLWPHSRALEAEFARTHERHLVLAQSVAGTLELYQQNVMATFAAVADSSTAGVSLSFAHELLDLQAFSHFCLVDAQTGVVLESRAISGFEPPDVLPPGLMAELLRRTQDDAPQMSQIWLGERGPQFLLVKDLGDVIMFASLSGAFVQALSDSVVFGERGHMIVIDAAGRVIAHPNPAWVATAYDLSEIEEIRDLYTHDDPDVLTFEAIALGEDVVAGAAPVNGTGWRVLVPQPLAEVSAPVVAGRISASLVLSAGLALSALVAMAAAAYILRPLKSLARAADQMANGAVHVAAPISRFAPSEIRYLGDCFDAMARRVQATMARITVLAREDAATGLLNKRAFADAAALWISEEDGTQAGTLLHVDLNDLKRINDIYGHSIGDQAIASVAKCLQRCFPPPSLLSRAGGDEFLVLVASTDLEAIVSQLQPILEGVVISVGPGLDASTTICCSVGAADVADNKGDLDLLVLKADEAMYYAKRRGLGFKFHDEDMKSRARRRTELATQLRRDVAAERVDAVFQPIFDAKSGTVASFETLARWHAQSLGDILPDEFLSVAKDIGVVSDLDRCVRRKAFAFARDLRMQGSKVPVAVNVTARDLAHTDFIKRFHEDLRASNLDGADVAVEVTEAIFHDRYGLAIQTLTKLAQAGVAVHLDDFGKGFSAHGLLPMCQFEALKVDMHFVGSPTQDDRAASIVASLAGLGAQLGLVVVFEGIETETERDLAVKYGADRLQGFFLERPMSHAQAIAWINSPASVTAAE